MVWKKTRVILYSILLSFTIFSLLVLPETMSGEDQPIHLLLLNIITALGFYSFYFVSIFLIFSVPVNLFSYVIVKNIPRNFQTIVNFAIHLIPAYGIGLYILGGLEMVVVFCASFVFVFDELIVWRRRKWTSFIAPLLIMLIIVGIYLYPSLESYTVKKRIREHGYPTVALQFGGESFNDLEGHYCYTSSGGCANGIEPYLLPLDDIGMVEFDRSADDEINVKVDNFAEKPTIYVHYIHHEKKIKKRLHNQTFTIPPEIPDQVIVFEIEMDKEFKTAYVALRSPDRRFEGL